MGLLKNKTFISLSVYLVFLLVLGTAALLCIANTDNIIYLSSVDDFQSIWNDPDGHYALGKQYVDVSTLDFNLSSEDRPFTGTFDGRGGVLGGLNLKGKEYDGGVEYGLFPSNKGTIENLEIQPALSSVYDISESEKTIFGFFAGTNYGTITNCQLFPISSNDVTMISSGGDLIFGGIAGINYGTIDSCYSRLDIAVAATNGVSIAGGVAGASFDNALIQKSKKSNKLSSSSPTKAVCSGICGQNSNSTVLNCFSLGDLVCNSDNGLSLSAGICAETLASNVSNCCSLDKATIHGGTVYAGGIAGENNHPLELLNDLSGFSVYSSSSNIVCGEIVSNIDGSDTTNNLFYLNSLSQSTTSNIGTKVAYSDLSLGLLQWDSSIWKVSSSGVGLIRW